MRSRSKHHFTKGYKGWLIIFALLFGVFLQSEGQAFTINVATKNPATGNALPLDVGFRYLIEEDNGFQTVPGVGSPTADWNPALGAANPTHTLGVNIHKSHAPVVCAGDTGAVGGASSVNLSVNNAMTADCFVGGVSLIDPAKHYMVSVIPWHKNPSYPLAGNISATPNSTAPWFSDQQGYTMSGHAVAGSDASVTIFVNKFPVPAAQITVLVFHDNQPINGAYDQPAETGLPRFDLLVTDIVGKMMQDAWGQPLGTTYKIVRSANGTTVQPYFPGGSFHAPIKNPADGTYQFYCYDGNGAQILCTDPGSTGVPFVEYAGNGTLTTCPTGNFAYDQANCTDLDTGVPLAAGEAVIRFVAPNKMTIEPIPPANDPDWILTATFEGTRGNDNWVRAKEPRFNIILGQLNWLAPFGFVKKMPMTLRTPRGQTAGTIRGQVIYAHDVHPPFSPGLAPGVPVPGCYVGLNNLSAADQQVYTQPCNADSTFSISNVPPGLYQVVVWDWPINAVIDFRNVTVPNNGGIVQASGPCTNPLVPGYCPVSVYGWFGTMMGSVFYDANGDGVRCTGAPPYNCNEPGIPQMRVNARFTDGSPYASMLTDAAGNYQFAQFFPWWRFMVMELDPGAIGAAGYSRFRTTGKSAVIDDGSYVRTTDVCAGCPNPNPPPNPNPWASLGINPQLQPGGQRFFTEKSSYPVLAGELYEEPSTLAMLLFSDMTNIIDWGKGNYDAPNADGSCPAGKVCNGGIRGFISYATSRTQENPQISEAQGWEPGVARVQLKLHRAAQGLACSISGKTCTTAGVDAVCNLPMETCETKLVCGHCTNVNDPTTCVPNAPDGSGRPACTDINITYTDSWDDNNPTGCVSTNSTFWPNPQRVGLDPAHLHTIRDCAETFRTWDQIRPGVFDGGYAFTGYCPGTLTASYNMTPSPGNPAGPTVTCSVAWVNNLPQGYYIVEAVIPKGYEILKWGDRNIEEGEPNSPFMAQPPECVGPAYNVPAFHTLFPDWQIQTAYPGPGQWFCNGQNLWAPDGSFNPSFTSTNINASGICTVAGTGPMAPLCTQKVAQVANGQNAIVDYRMFTQVPKSTRIWGWVSDDLHLESNPYSPNASSNFAPSWLPVSIQDWGFNEVGRFYTDQWGKFNGLVPSTYTIFTPNPLGMSSGIFTIFPNDIGPVLASSTGPGAIPQACPPNPVAGQCVIDPWYNPGLGRETIRENWDFYAGKTTFVDTIVIPTTGFVANRIPLNCDYADKTPIIDSVDGPEFNGHGSGGPVIFSNHLGPAGGIVTIKSINFSGAGGLGAGLVAVPNPDYNPSLPAGVAGCGVYPTTGVNCATVVRDHGFGAAQGAGSVTVGGAALAITSWSQGIITATVPLAGVTTGQLVVTRNDTLSPGGGAISSVVGVTFHVLAPGAYVDWVTAPTNDVNGVPICNPYTDATRCMRIQPAIDAAANSVQPYPKLIIVGPGNYMENPIMYAPVQLQGVGGATVLDNTYAIGNLPMKDFWITEFANLDAGGWITLPPGALTDFTFEQGAGIMVMSCDYTTPGSCTHGNQFATIANPIGQATGANPMIDGMVITEASEAGGGVYVVSSSPYLQISNCEILGNQGSLSGGIRYGNGDLFVGPAYTNSHNEHGKIMHNRIAMNGSLQSGGGGISMYKGSDNYQITNNLICGNFSIQYGGGIDHFGVSTNSYIGQNVIVSNESFDQAGGIMVGGNLQIVVDETAEVIPPALTEGSGTVTIQDNLIQGNKAGDDGGGVSLLNVNGQEVRANNAGVSGYNIYLFNNMIVDNSSGDHGGGIAIDDALFVYSVNDTIAYNDATSTGSGAFGGGCTEGVEAIPPGQVCPPPGEALGGTSTSVKRVGGIATFALSTQLAAVVPGSTPNTFCNPKIYNSIIWKNRSFNWDATWCSGLGGLRPDVQNLCPGGVFGGAGGAPEAPYYWDFGVYGTAAPQLMSPLYSKFLPTASNGQAQAIVGTGDITNLTDPPFVHSYLNIYQASSKGAAFGNFVQVTMTPNGLVNAGGVLYGNYHVTASPGTGGTQYNATYPELGFDYDHQVRPSPGDIGADQFNAAYVWFPWYLLPW